MTQESFGLKNNKKDRFLKLIQRGWNRIFVANLSAVSPTLASKYLYKRVFKKKLNLDNPMTFNEKLLWLKLNVYDKNPLVSQCADKYRVREYVKACGYGHLLNDLIDVWKSVDEIDWESLPEKFVLKCNHGAGYNIICDDKSKLDIESTKKKLRKWMKRDYWKESAEVHYKYIPKRIICEKYLESKTSFLPADYKIYCFNGIPKLILFIADRDCDKKGVFMSPEWEFISWVGSSYKKFEKIPEKPESLEEMIRAAAKLSAPFPFVRVDFYHINNRPVFGELTFTPGACLYTSQTTIDGVTMGELLDISKEQRKKYEKDY